MKKWGKAGGLSLANLSWSLESDYTDIVSFLPASQFDGEVNALCVGDEVEFSLARKGSKASAERVKLIPKGTIPAEVRHV